MFHIDRRAPKAIDSIVTKVMRSNKSRDTKPKQKVKAMLRKLGFPSYRLNWKKAYR